MANIKFNMDSLVGNGVHRPRSNGEVLYLRKDSDKPKPSKYSSPTNLRALAITESKICIRTWVGVGVLNSTEQVHATNLDKVSDGRNFNTLAYMIKTEHMRHQQYAQQCAAMGMSNVEKPDVVRITGTGLGCLVSPWICSNVETIVFDRTLLLCDAFRGMLNSMLLMKDEHALEIMMYKAIGEKWRDRFKLLNKIVYIENLGILDKPEVVLSKNFNKHEAAKIANSIGCVYSYLELQPKSDRLDVRDGIYLLDDTLRKMSVSTSNSSDGDKTNESSESKQVELKKEERPEIVALAKQTEMIISSQLYNSSLDSGRACALNAIWALKLDLGDELAFRVLNCYSKSVKNDINDLVNTIFSKSLEME